MTKEKIVYEEIAEVGRITFSKLTITSNTFIDLMLCLKKNEPENYNKIRDDFEESVLRHLRETNQIKKIQ